MGIDLFKGRVSHIPPYFSIGSTTYPTALEPLRPRCMHIRAHRTSRLQEVDRGGWALTTPRSRCPT
eukprot:6197692-Pleurochrysis_carterae.AAC.1